MTNTRFSKYMDVAKASSNSELKELACAGYLLLDMTENQIHRLANYLATERGYEVMDGRLTNAQPKPHKVVLFGACELTL